MGSFKAWTVPAEDVMIMHAVKVCGQEWKKNCSTAVRTSRRTTLWESWRLWSGDIIWVIGLTEESAPPTAGFLRQPEESSTMIVSFSLHNSCSNKMCQVILTKPVTICKIKLYIQCSTCRRINELTGIFKFENTKILSHYIHNIHSWKYAQKFVSQPSL